MNSQELETAVHLHLNFVVAIFEDEHYSLIKWKEEAQYGQAASVSFTNPDFVALAKAMRCEGTRIEKAEDLIPAIKKGFTYDVPVNYSENMKLTNALKQLPHDL
jgi:acetolactate synthase-1/2/3 large subunit